MIDDSFPQDEQLFSFQGGLPIEISLAHGQLLSSEEARTGVRHLDILEHHLNAIPDRILDFDLELRDKYLLLYYNELKVNNESRLLISESNVQKGLFIFQLGTLKLSTDEMDVIEQVRDIKKSETFFNDRVPQTEHGTKLKDNTKVIEDGYYGEVEKNYALQLEGRAYGTNNPEMQKNEVGKTKEVSTRNIDSKNFDKSLLQKNVKGLKREWAFRKSLRK